ncbi:MAG: hypothetical protein A2505_00835 [Deltaproteobacteria bacterium RIFOXYD12_FULL_55_16]|nr:MAG: hypothetical protein A2505_00835 [Deltaproteobacteria bacterium RIFOXYD12_FULL_55_16]
MSGNRLLVSVGGHLAGQLVRGGNPASSASADFTYIYDSHVAADMAVSLIMPVDQAVYANSHNTHIHSVFEMNLPEGRLREELRLKFSKAFSVYDDLTLLGLVGGTTIGRLRYAREENSAALAQSPPPCNLTEIMTYNGTENLLSYLMDRYAMYSGVAGVQPKVLVQDKGSSKLSIDAQKRLSAKDSTHIVKAWDDDFPGLAANEFFCMQAAEKSGLVTPTIQLADNGKFLAVERFDLNKETGEYCGFEDFCALSDFPSAKKYAGSYERLAKGLSVFLEGEALLSARRKFFKMIVLNCMVRNGDAHLKNFGILYDSPAIEHRTLAPVFDIVTTTVYIPTDSTALTMNGTKRWPDGKMLAEFGAHRCHLSPKETSQITEQVADAINDTGRPLREYAEAHPEFQQTGMQMLNVWEQGINQTRQCPLSIPSPPGRGWPKAG